MRNHSLLMTGKGVAGLIVGILSLNVIASIFFVRCDLTEDSIYSLTEGSRRIIEKLPEGIDIKLYFSRSHKELPPIIKTYATRVEEVLREYAGSSGGKISVSVVDPKPDTDDEEWARKYGLQGVQLPSGEQLYFGVVILKGDREVNMPYLDPRREEFLEYDISEALMQLVNKEKPKIGVLSSMQLDGNPHGGQEGWVLMNFLRRNYEAETIAADANSIKEDIKLLLVIHPKALSDKTQYAIDQFLVRGGKLIVAVDPMSRVEMSMSDPQARMMGGQANFGSSLDKLFTAWNIEFNSGELVGDATYTTQVNAGGMGVDYPFFMSLGQAAFVTGSPVTGQLNQMLIAEGGAIASKADSPYTFEPLLETTTDSGTIGAQMAGFMGPDALAKDFKPDGKKRTLAAMVRGKFKTAFPGGYKAPPPPADDKEAKPEEPPPGPHIETAENEGAIVVIGDVDFMHDSNSVQVMRFGPQSIARPINDNLNFVFNSIDLLAGSEDLISIRSRGKIARPFTKVAEIQKDAAKRWKDKEEQLSSELTKLETQLNDMQKQRTDGNRFALTPEQQDEIKKFRAEEARLRKERRLVRKNLREDIESLGHLLIALNMLVVPLGTSAFGFSVFMRRARRMRQGREQ